MKKENFCNIMDSLRDFYLWERKLFECGIDLTGTPAATLAENLWACLCNFDPNWSYDSKEGVDWLIEWSCGESNAYYQCRHGVEFYLVDAGALYDFIVFMNERGWWED